ncbi:MAG TPA: hypothetical protein PK339_12415 [Flavitalea sp.]|nr:hypothetical protein [Flavitalea sp.]
MKNLFLCLALLSILACSAQDHPQPIGSPRTNVKALGGLYVDSVLYLPLTFLSSELYRPGALMYQQSDSTLYTWTGYQWLKQAGGGEGGASNLSRSITSNSIAINNDNGSGVILPAGDGINAGLVSATKYNQWDNKLSSVSVSATPNASGIFIGSSAGSGATLSLVDGVNAGLLSAAMKAYWDGKLSSVSVFGSIQGNGIAPLQLKGDVTSPGANMVYGTNGAGVHVWKPDTASGGSGESEWVKISIADLDASSGLDTSKVYWISDSYKQGPFVWEKKAVNQTDDDSATIIITEDLNQYRRAYSGGLDGKWFGIIPDDETKAASNFAAWERAIAARKSGQTLFLSGGTNWWFDNTLSIVNYNFNFKSFVVIEGNLRQADPTKDAIHIEGWAPQAWRITGRIQGANTGANDSLSYAAYTGNGVTIKNAYGGVLQFHEITNFKRGIHMIGNDGDGTQYFLVEGVNGAGSGKIYDNEYQILMEAQPGEAGYSWVNENNFRNIQLGNGTQPGPRGTFGVVMTGPEGTSARTFESNDFWYVSFEGVRHGLIIDYGSSTNFYNSRFEEGPGPAILYPIRINNSTGVHTKFFGAGPFTDDFFVEGQRGLYTELIGGQLWGEVDARSASTTSHTLSTGSKTFTVSTGNVFAAAKPVTVKYDDANYMTGTVTSYNSGTGALVVSINSVVGSGTYTSWAITSNIGQERLGLGFETLPNSPALMGVENQRGKIVVKGTSWPGNTAMGSMSNHRNMIQLYNLAQRPSTENGIIKIDTLIRWGAYKKTYANITSQTSYRLPANIGYIRFAPTAGNVTAYLYAGDLTTSQFEEFKVEVVNTNYTLEIRNSATNDLLLSSSNFTATGVYKCVYRSGSFVVYKDDGSGGGGGGNPTAGNFNNTPTAKGLSTSGSDVILHAADSTNPGGVSTGNQKWQGGKQMDSVITPKLSMWTYDFGKLDIIRRKNGLSFGENSTPNVNSTTLTAYNFGSGSSSKDVMFGFGKTGINWVGMGNDGTDMIFVTEKNTGGFEFRKNVGYSSATLQAGSALAKIFGSTGNVLIQTGGTFTDAGYKLDLKGTLRTSGVNRLENLAGTGTRMVVANANGDLSTQAIPSGGGGGSSIFNSGSGTGSPYYHDAGPVNIGVNPAQSYAWTHWGASTATRGLWEFDDESVWPTVPRAHTISYDAVSGRFLYTNGSNLPEILATDINVMTLKNKTWEGSKIGKSYIDATGMAAGDVLVSDGNDIVSRRPPYTLAFSQADDVSFNNTATATSILDGGAQSLPAVLKGDIIEVKGSGTFGTTSGANTLTFTFTFNGVTETITSAALIPSQSDQDYNYTVRLTPRGSVNNVGVYIESEVNFNGAKIFNSLHFANSFNALSPTVNVTAKFNTAAVNNAVSARMNTIEIKRK